jgi:hypothetical protein
MTMIALTLVLNIHAFVKDRTFTLYTAAGDVRFDSTSWKPVDGKSLIVETVQNQLPDGDLVYTYPSTSSGTALRASRTLNGIIPVVLPPAGRRTGQ